MDKVAINIEDADVLNEVDKEWFEWMAMKPMSYFMGNDSDDLIIVKFDKQTLIDSYKMILTYPHIFRPMHIVLVIHFYLDLCQRKMRFSYQVIYFEPQIVIFNVFEFVKVYSRIGEDLSIKYCHH